MKLYIVTLLKGIFLMICKFKMNFIAKSQFLKCTELEKQNDKKIHMCTTNIPSSYSKLLNRAGKNIEVPVTLNISLSSSLNPLTPTGD